MISAIIFDFDGVLLESVDVKTEAFRQLFAFSPDHVNEIIRFHLENGGMSRFDKFRHIYQNILHEPLSDEQFNILSHRFSLLVEQGIIDAPFVDGALELLQTISKKCPLFIVSATPQDELIRIVRARRIPGFFKGIFGSPLKKHDHILRIIQENKFDPARVVFVGDAVNDWEAATACGVKFIARVKPGDPDRFSNSPGVEQRITSMYDLKKFLEGDS
jgi:HAD superfamily hydrolase (TIGR01549 family)